MCIYKKHIKEKETLNLCVYKEDLEGEMEGGDVNVISKTYI